MTQPEPLTNFLLPIGRMAKTTCKECLEREATIRHLLTALKLANNTIQKAAERQERDWTEASHIRESADT